DRRGTMIGARHADLAGSGSGSGSSPRRMTSEPGPVGSVPDGIVSDFRSPAGLSRGSHEDLRSLPRELFFLVLELDHLGDLPPLPHRRSLPDTPNPSLEVRQVVDVDARPTVERHPGPRRNVGDRIVAGEIFAIGEPMIEDLVEPL